MKAILVLLVGWIADLMLGDPAWLPHPVVWFGKIIACFERWLNRGRYRKAKGALTALVLIVAVYIGVYYLQGWFYSINVFLGMGFGVGGHNASCEGFGPRIRLEIKIQQANSERT